MVELELEDYSEIFDWFTLCFGKKKKLKLSSEISLSQSSDERCSSVNFFAIQTIVTAFSPDAYVIN